MRPTRTNLIRDAMWSNYSGERKIGSDKQSWWSNKRAAQFLYVLFFLMIVSGVWRGTLSAKGYEYYPEIVRISAHINRGGAKIIHHESILKGTTAWLGNSVESIYSPNEMFKKYTKDLTHNEWLLALIENERLIFCKGELSLQIKYLGTSAQFRTGKSLYKYSEDFQWPDWGGYCKKH